MRGRPATKFPLRTMKIGQIIVFPAKKMPLRELQQRLGSAIGQLRRLYGVKNRYVTHQVKDLGFKSVAVRRVA